MGITYNGATNIITVTGYTEGAPCTFLDIYNADVSGGWGVVSHQCVDQYCFDAKLCIGDGTTVTWFADTNKQVRFKHITSALSYKKVEIKNNAHFRSGELVSGKTSRAGCDFSLESGYEECYFMGQGSGSSADIKFYSTSFSQAFSAPGGSGILVYYFENPVLYNCFSAEYFRVSNCYNVDMFNLVAQGGKFCISRSTGNYEKLHLTGYKYPFYTSFAYVLNVKNAYVRNITDYLMYLTAVTVDCSLINIDSDIWTFYWSSLNTKKVYRKYELDLKVTDTEGNEINTAAVKIWDLNDNLVVNVTTGSDGKIVTQTLNYGYYNQTGGNTPTMQTPHIIEISKQGYKTYKNKFALGKKHDLLIALLPFIDKYDITGIKKAILF